MPSSLEINDVFWGTTMPIGVLLSGNYTELRARGSYSVCVTDQAVFAASVGAPEDLSFRARSLVQMRVMDVVGEASQTAADLSQLASQADTLAGVVKAKLEEDFNALGLTLTRFGFQAIESTGM